MAFDFKILAHQEDDRLYVKLEGDFDSSSASELLRVLKNNTDGVDCVFIDTEDVTDVCSVGRTLFHSHLLHALDNRSVGFVLTGENAFQMAPEGSSVL